LQEFLGYCLLPTPKGQKMLMLIGKGGEGKSRIGLVMRSLCSTANERHPGCFTNMQMNRPYKS